MDVNWSSRDSEEDLGNVSICNRLVSCFHVNNMIMLNFGCQVRSVNSPSGWSPSPQVLWGLFFLFFKSRDGCCSHSNREEAGELGFRPRLCLWSISGYRVTCDFVSPQVLCVKWAGIVVFFLFVSSRVMKWLNSREWQMKWHSKNEGFESFHQRVMKLIQVSDKKNINMPAVGGVSWAHTVFHSRHSDLSQ